MADHKTKSASMLPGMSPDRRSDKLVITRLELSSQKVARVHSHETESVVIVLEGTLCVHLQGRAITLRSNDILRIPADARYYAEQLAPVNALRISVAPHDDAHPKALSESDSDHYLWGV